MESQDVVNNPAHYNIAPSPLEARIRDVFVSDFDPVNIECIEAMSSMLSTEEMIGYLRGNSFKYRWRYRHKNGLQDLEKAQWYERKLMQVEKVVKSYGDEFGLDMLP